IDELGVALFALDLEVGEHRLTPRAPVDDIVVAVDQALFPEPHERLAHGPRQARVHRDALARPVARSAKALELADDGAARLLLPPPGKLQVGLAADVVPRFSLGGELAIQNDVDGDR